MLNESRVCVIGAGPCGLTTLKNLLEQKITNITVFEQNHQLGGNWIYNKENNHASVYETTHLISSKRLSSFDDFPMPDDYPDYPSHSQVLHYFNAYASHYNLIPHIKFNTRVLEVKRDLNDSCWQVTYKDTEGSHQIQFDYVLVANGHHWSPSMPNYPGQFQGETLHAHHYKNATPFKDKKVLVVGGGNSGCDIAVEVARVAASTTLSLRHGQHIFPKFIFGKPTDIAFKKIAWLPFRFQQQLAHWLIRALQGRYAKYNLPTPTNRPLSTHPTINSELLYFIRHGKIKTRGSIDRFEANEVHFSDESYDTFDSVIFATGYTIDFPFFDPSLIDFKQTPNIPLYLKMIHPQWDTLYFIGLFQPQGCIWPLADHQARIIAKIISAQLKRPPDLTTLIDKEQKKNKQCFHQSPRHVLEVDSHRFKKQLLRCEMSLSQ